MQIQQITSFQFSMQVGETVFNFSIPAPTQKEACVKLIAALDKISEELKTMIKPGPN